MRSKPASGRTHLPELLSREGRLIPVELVPPPADDLSFLRPEGLAASLDLLLAVVAVLEGNRVHRNLCPKGEPQLGRRGLYDAIGERVDRRRATLALLRVLNQSDGRNDLLAIAERADLAFNLLRWAADRLLEADLLEEVKGGAAT